MKKNSFYKYILLLSVLFMVFSCQNDDFDTTQLESTWQDQTNLRVQSLEDETFTWISSASSWLDEEIAFDVAINTGLPIGTFAKIDFYITAEEANGFNFTAPFDTQGKILTSVENIPDSGEITLNININDLYDLFENDFVNDRSTQAVLEGDFFSLFWVITNVDGTTLDSRQSLDTGGNNFVFPIEVFDVPLSWEGTYDFEVLVNNDTFFGLPVGTTGTNIITFDRAEGEIFIYNVEKLNFDYGVPIFAQYSGKLFQNINTGEVTVGEAIDAFGGPALNFATGGPLVPHWQLSNVSSDSVDVTWSDDFNTPFGGWQIVRLTRTDGVEFPANTNTTASPFISFPLAGTFDYEVLEDPDPFSGLGVGFTSQVEISFDGAADGVFTYNVNKLNFDYGAGSPLFANYSGKLFHNTNTGEITVGEPIDSFGGPALNFSTGGVLVPHWEISSLSGDTMEILWSDDFNTSFGAFLRVNITRNDGEDWPSDLNTTVSPFIP